MLCSQSVCVFMEPVQPHFKGRGRGGDGRRGFWRMEAAEESAPLPQEWHRWEHCLPQPGLHVPGGGEGSLKIRISPSLCLNIYLFVLLFLLPHPSLPSMAKLMASCQNLLMHLLCRFRLSKALAKSVCKHLVNICLPSHEILWVAGKINKPNW